MASTAAVELVSPLPEGGLTDRAVLRNLLLSHAITRLGTQGWLFVAPLAMLRFTPGRLLGPACWGMCTMLATTFLGPPLGAWADRTDRRRVVTLGVAVQLIAVSGATVALIGSHTETNINMPGVIIFTLFGAVERLGLNLSDVSVKREWVPRLFDGERLVRTNAVMSQIDLVTEVIGPFLAGLLVTLANRGDADSATAFGFVAVGVLNALTFWPQLSLLRSVYAAREARLQPTQALQNGATPIATRSLCAFRPGAWHAWVMHPSGIQLLGMSYALLYLTVLSPHGALLTAYLAERGVGSWALSLLRGAGALVGVLGVMCRPPLGRWLGERRADAICVVSLAALMCFALIAFKATGDAYGLSGPMLAFMAAVCLGRPGLYAFELGVLNAEQDLADSAHRTAIGTVDAALQSGFTFTIYTAGMVMNHVDQFGLLVGTSAFFVTSGAAVYLLWLLLFRSHAHCHNGEGGECGRHAHTTQQQEQLDDGWHDHIHYHPPCASWR
eukprot:NODE_4451_length_1889_cov_10.458570.p1 GENE.NODE_4451_length_1889_cov_10.458570~~NODE_4451_length_1889_cov_10.458570.p1  ORF type:complete len:546 (-),score=140.78 NODE_4451_length_1889_cov_10.458570:250-1746(-)